MRSFAFAFNGIRSCFTTEQNFRIHTLLAVAVLALAIIFNISAYEWIATALSIAFVIVMEMMNTAIEKLCDVVHRDLHPAIKKIKDITAGAVLIAALSALATGLVIFLPKIITHFKPI